MGRQRRFGTDQTYLALHAFKQGGFLTTYIGASAFKEPELIVKTRAQNILPQKAMLMSNINGFLQDIPSMRILATQIDVALGGANCIAGNHHALNQCIGIKIGRATCRETVTI